VIASQAVISGAFTMVREAVQLGYLPRMRVRHTSSEIRGQVYLPAVNGILLALVVAAVLGFRSADNLAAAFGIAVSGTMLISTLLVLVVARRLWHWSPAAIATFACVFVVVDIAYFAANAIKIESGGWFPLALGGVMFAAMLTWRRGRELMAQRIRGEGMPLAMFVDTISAHPPRRVPGLAVFLTASADVTPQALLHNLKHNKVLHEQNVVLTTEVMDEPRVSADERFEASRLDCGFCRVTLRFGFAEDIDIPQCLGEHAITDLHFDSMSTTYFASLENIEPGRRRGMARWRDMLFVFLARNAQRATEYFAIPSNRLVEIGRRVEI
jgi:KUP system potassium uptake protein